MDEGQEVLWFTHVPDARIMGGYLHFYAPDGNRAVVKLDIVFRNIGMDDVWHVEFAEADGSKFAKVSPSIHYVGHWHSPNPVIFRLVDELVDPRK